LIAKSGRFEKDVLMIRGKILSGEPLVNLHIHFFTGKKIKNL
jgi:hypothetical protein